VNFTPSASTVPPLLLPSWLAFGAPCASSQLASSKIAMTFGECCFATSTALPTWSPCPWVIATTSQRSTCFSFSGHFGLSNHGST
jgi:hypothetical protein